MENSINSSLAIVILAAGGASRFGSAKQLAVHQNKTLLQHKIDTCCQLNQYPSYVVLGAAYQQIIAVTDFGNCQVIHNIHWHSGMSSSIKATITELGHHYDGILFLAADQLLISDKQLKHVIKAWQEQPSKLVAAKFDDEITIPAIFPNTYYEELLSLSGDKGGKKVLLAHPNNLLSIDLPQAKFDIDYPEDLQMLK